MRRQSFPSLVSANFVVIRNDMHRGCRRRVRRVQLKDRVFITCLRIAILATRVWALWDGYVTIYLPQRTFSPSAHRNRVRDDNPYAKLFRRNVQIILGILLFGLTAEMAVMSFILGTTSSRLDSTCRSVPFQAWNIYCTIFKAISEVFPGVEFKVCIPLNAPSYFFA